MEMQTSSYTPNNPTAPKGTELDGGTADPANREPLRPKRAALKHFSARYEASFAHHSHPQLRIHYFIPGSKLTLSTNLLHHSLLAPPGLPSLTILDRTYSAQWFSFKKVIFLSFILGRA